MPAPDDERDGPTEETSTRRPSTGWPHPSRSSNRRNQCTDRAHRVERRTRRARDPHAPSRPRLPSRSLPGIILTTTSRIEGMRILQHHDIVSGEAIVGANIFRDCFASIPDPSGGRSAACRRAMNQTPQAGVDRPDGHRRPPQSEHRDRRRHRRRPVPGDQRSRIEREAHQHCGSLRPHSFHQDRHTSQPRMLTLRNSGTTSRTQPRRCPPPSRRGCRPARAPPRHVSGQARTSTAAASCDRPSRASRYPASRPRSSAAATSCSRSARTAETDASCARATSADSTACAARTRSSA